MSDAVQDAIASRFEWNDEAIKVWNVVVARRGLRAPPSVFFAEMAATISPAPNNKPRPLRLPPHSTYKSIA